MAALALVWEVEKEWALPWMWLQDKQQVQLLTLWTALIKVKDGDSINMYLYIYTHLDAESIIYLYIHTP